MTYVHIQKLFVFAECLGIYSTFVHIQELANILEYMESQRAGGNGSTQDSPDLAEEAGEASEGEDEGKGDEGAARQGKAPLLQTFVFSATLTLPLGLRKRLRKGELTALALFNIDTSHVKLMFKP